MKKTVTLVLLMLSISTSAFSQSGTMLETKAENFDFEKGKVDFLTYKGRKSMKVSNSGQVVIKDLNFRDGIIEFDAEAILPGFAQGVYFHRKDNNEQEMLYLRVTKIGDTLANEAIQYTPYFDGVNMWDMYPQYQAPAPLKKEDWNHIKLVISGKQMKVFVNDTPVLYIPKLEGRETEGSIAFEGASYISNIEIKPDETEGLSPLEGADLTQHESNYIRNWAMTESSLLPQGTEPTTLLSVPKNDAFVEKINAERYGLVNLTRRFGLSELRRIVWLKATITAKEHMKTNLQLGFSDEIWIYLNDRITYTDKNIFRQNMKKYPNGRISVQNGETELDLKQGVNELMIGISNDFYGWGLMARLEDMEGIVAISAYDAPKKMVIENVDQFVGEYVVEGYDTYKLTLSQNSGELTVQLPNQQEIIPLSYLGNNSFNVGLGIVLEFSPDRKKVIIKENGFENEFVKIN